MMNTTTKPTAAATRTADPMLTFFLGVGFAGFSAAAGILMGRGFTNSAIVSAIFAVGMWVFFCIERSGTKPPAAPANSVKTHACVACGSTLIKRKTGEHGGFMSLEDVAAYYCQSKECARFGLLTIAGVTQQEPAADAR